MSETIERNAHWWRESPTGPYNCVVLIPEGVWSSVHFRAYTWRSLRKVMRAFGVEPGRIREREVAINESEGIRRSLSKRRRPVGVSE